MKVLKAGWVLADQIPIPWLTIRGSLSQGLRKWTIREENILDHCYTISSAYHAEARVALGLTNQVMAQFDPCIEAEITTP